MRLKKLESRRLMIDNDDFLDVTHGEALSLSDLIIDSGLDNQSSEEEPESGRNRSVRKRNAN